MRPPKITAKQERFCQEYVVDFNATAAAERSGYSKSSRTTLKQQGTENLAKPIVQARIRALQAPLKELADVSAEKVLRELAAIAFAKPKTFMTWDNSNVTLISSELLTETEAAAVAGVTYTSSETQFGGITKVDLKFHDKVRALQILCDRYLSTDFAIEVLRRQGYDVVPRSLAPSQSKEPDNYSEEIPTIDIIAPAQRVSSSIPPPESK